LLNSGFVLFAVIRTIQCAQFYRKPTFNLLHQDDCLTRRI